MDFIVGARTVGHTVIADEPRLLCLGPIRWICSRSRDTGRRSRFLDVPMRRYRQVSNDRGDDAEHPAPAASAVTNKALHRLPNPAGAAIVHFGQHIIARAGMFW